MDRKELEKELQETLNLIERSAQAFYQLVGKRDALINIINKLPKEGENK